MQTRIVFPVLSLIIGQSILILLLTTQCGGRAKCKFALLRVGQRDKINIVALGTKPPKNVHNPPNISYILL